MKKLLLTSAGLINNKISQIFLNELSKSVQDTRVLVVAYTQTSEEEFYVDESKRELIDLGLQNIVIANMHYPVEIGDLGDFNAIYVCGGNTFAILDKMRETKLDTYIMNQVNKGAVYVGVSAGSIIAGPDIEIAGLGSEGDKNEIRLEDLSGFNLTDVMVFPHFHEGLRGEVEGLRENVSHKIIEITDEQAVLVKDTVVEIID